MRTSVEPQAKKPIREASAIKPVIKVALEVAEEHINHRVGSTESPYTTIDVLTRLRAAICLAEDAGLSPAELKETELKVMLHG